MVVGGDEVTVEGPGVLGGDDWVMVGEVTVEGSRTVGGWGC